MHHERASEWFTDPRISRPVGLYSIGEVPRLEAHSVERKLAAIFAADFASAVDAVQCAVEVQDAIAKENADRPAGEQMRFRIGIHVGDIIVQGDSLFGDAVNIAARLEALAEPVGICISAIKAYRITGETSPTASPVIDLRFHCPTSRRSRYCPSPI
jgi:class 3 adenylate cyclase